MEIDIKKIYEGQYLCDIIKSLETNTIYFKTLPGLGATTMEIEENRHSLILEPHVPVILGKATKKILGVKKGITVDKIITYLMDNSIKYKKILCTPESFQKVLKACEICNINIKKTFFLLYDECERTMKDIKFRKSIIKPMEHFFEFDNKAFISATAVIPSDRRFEKQHFKQVIIDPQFDYSKEIDLILSNNVYLSTKKICDDVKGKKICVFLNSIEGIKKLITYMEIKDKSHIYCAEDRLSDLKNNGYKAFDKISHKNGEMVCAQYNFFSSRFNSAVDMLMEEKPIVIMVSDVKLATHSAIDPKSEAIQIVGRFRKGTDSLYAVSNIKDLYAKTESEAIQYLKECQFAYKTIQGLALTHSNEGTKDVLEEALTLVTFSDFVNQDGSLNSYMWDNYLYEESVKMIYQFNDNIIHAYKNPYFETKVQLDEFKLDGEDMNIITGMSFIEIRDKLITILKNLSQPAMFFQIDNYQEIIENFRKSYPEIVNGYFGLGLEKLKCCYSKQQISKELKLKYNEDQKTNYPFLKDLYTALPIGFSNTLEIIKDIFKSICEKHDLILSMQIETFNLYIELSKRKSLPSKNWGNRIKGHEIIGHRFKIN